MEEKRISYDELIKKLDDKILELTPQEEREAYAKKLEDELKANQKEHDKRMKELKRLEKKYKNADEEVKKFLYILKEEIDNSTAKIDQSTKKAVKEFMLSLKDSINNDEDKDLYEILSKIFNDEY